MIESYEFAEQASNIKAMMQSPGWEFYCRVILEKIATTTKNALADEPEKLLYHRGSVDGMEAAVLTAKDCLNMAAQHHSEIALRERQGRLHRNGDTTL